MIYSHLLPGRFPPQWQAVSDSPLCTLQTLTQAWLTAHMSKSLLAGMYQTGTIHLMGYVWRACPRRLKLNQTLLTDLQTTYQSGREYEPSAYPAG